LFKRCCIASSLSVFLPRNRCSNSSNDGGEMKIEKTSNFEFCFICWAPCMSTSIIQHLFCCCTSWTDYCLCKFWSTLKCKPCTRFRTNFHGHLRILRTFLFLYPSTFHLYSRNNSLFRLPPLVLVF